MIKFTTTPARKATPTRTEMFPGVPHITHPVGQPYDDLNFFDVPDEEYCQGNRTGILVAGQLIKVERDTEEGVLMSAVRVAIGVVGQSYAQTDDITRYGKVGAAVGFLETISQILQEACCKLDLSTVISGKLSYFERAAEQDLNDMKVQNAALVTLMFQPGTEVTN